MRALPTGVLSMLTLAAAIFVVLCALLYWRQDSAIFFPRPNDPQLWRQLQASRVEIASAGQTLEGWWTDNPQATSRAMIVYFGGNAEDVLYTASHAAAFNAQHLLVVNYRGYGGSTGQPGQEALYADALAIYDYVIARGIEPGNVVAMGRSLGSGAASMLAGSRPLGGAILVTPFDSLAAVAAAHYPIFPVRFLLRHPFPSLDWARKAHAPALFLAAGIDHIIPPAHAQRLHDAWAGTKRIHILDGVGHNDIESNGSYYRLINEFLAVSLPAQADLRLQSS